MLLYDAIFMSLESLGHLMDTCNRAMVQPRSPLISALGGKIGQVVVGLPCGRSKLHYSCQFSMEPVSFHSSDFIVSNTTACMGDRSPVTGCRSPDAHCTHATMQWTLTTM